MHKTCFVVMAIGDQNYGEYSATSAELKTRYSDLIKEAIEKAFPGLDVTRADEVSMPGSISSDIVARIIHSDFVIADVTYPNPNVFYELGLRHASRSGTIIIRDRSGPRVPFDISHLRYIEYDNTPTGLKELSLKLKEYFDFFEANPEKPDNHFLEFARYTKHKSYDYSEKESEVDEQSEMFMAMMQSPNLRNLLVSVLNGQEVSQEQLIMTMASDPEASLPLVRLIAKSSVNAQQTPSQNQLPMNRQARRAKKK